jgi:hypothetical protein
MRPRRSTRWRCSRRRQVRRACSRARLLPKTMRKMTARALDAPMEPSNTAPVLMSMPEDTCKQRSLSLSLSPPSPPPPASLFPTLTPLYPDPPIFRPPYIPHFVTSDKITFHRLTQPPSRWMTRASRPSLNTRWRRVKPRLEAGPRLNV